MTTPASPGGSARAPRIIRRSILGLLRPIVALGLGTAAPTRLASAGPGDAPHGSIDGSNRLHVLVVGGISGSARGIPTFDLGVAAQLAQSLASATGRGVDWESLSDENAKLAGTAPPLRSLPGLASFDVIVLSPGSADVLGFTPFRRWRAELIGLLDFLATAASRAALIVVTAVPDVSPHVQLGPLLSAGLAVDSTEFNAIAVEACAVRHRAQFVALPAPAASDFVDGVFNYRGLYRRWSDSLRDVVVAHLRSV